MVKRDNESEEMYLETILLLKEEKEIVRAIDVSEKMNFSRASVSVALKTLKEKGYIDVLSNGNIVFLDKGREYANKIFDRHKNLTKFFVSLGVNKEVAEEDACKLEHILSEETYQKIKEKVLEMPEN